MEFVVVTGLSGAGRSTAANALEDLGWFKIDNLPARLLSPVVDLVEPGPATDRVVLGLGAGGDRGEVAEAIGEVRHKVAEVRVVFVEAATDALVARFESTRRRHPLDDEVGSVSSFIDRERELLAPARAVADVVIDTTELNVHDLRRRLERLFRSPTEDRMRVLVCSFGYKHGLPRDVDMVLDVRFLPNPHWDPELRPLRGTDDAVRDFVLGQPDAATFLERVDGLLELVIPASEREGRTYLTIGIGCTGGHHRSVAIAEELARRDPLRDVHPLVSHRDLHR